MPNLLLILEGGLISLFSLPQFLHILAILILILIIISLPPSLSPSLSHSIQTYSAVFLLYPPTFSPPLHPHRTIVPRASQPFQPTKFNDTQPIMSDLQGRKVFKVFNQDFIVDERYTVTKELGQGAYGIVW